MGMMKRANQPRRGFTLVEVLIVLAILVMLVAMVVPRFLGARKQGEIRAAKTQIGMFQTALEHYAADAKTFPTTEQGLAALLAKPSDLDESTAWEGPYLNGEAIPKDPWGQEYHYEYPPTHGTADRADIWSNGPNKNDDAGGEDDIVSWSTAAGGEGGGGAKPAGAPASTPAPASPPAAR
jgi:general secretion pathway protein G